MKKLALLVLLALPVTAATFPKSLHNVCAQLQKDGWTAPLDPLSGKPMQAEMDVRGVMYLCNLERVLPRAGGTGHPPDLQALLSNDGKENSVILAASIWCEADQPAALEALVKAVTSVFGAPPPDTIAAAIRAAKEAKVTADGLSYEVDTVHIYADACRDVPANKLGPVLMKVEVAVKAAR